ncbi:DNA (Cytosine-5)-methyltransferase DRM1/2 isoform 2 [Hibiscus syriacus]|uniref:DNA (Cytosine-5)-methyltransferase DRM1/2 isoform 2 n=1 Tax=Hibiscus syriacus TaxID=106335 RepID=A0A6A2WXH3_HIBSY|nr:DNA (Cytosine-5)-methyltransferase DRM1/2 isoform 2 [Hibiscus syriacus]
MQHVDSDNYSSDYEVIFQNDFTYIDSSSDTEEILNSDSDEENKLLYLTKMGYPDVEASIAIERCGPNSSIAKLTDFICAAQMAKAADALLPRKLEKKLLNEDDHAVHLSTPMIGFEVLTEPDQITQRTLPEDAIGSPYFYFENVALAPVGSAKLTEMIRKTFETYDDEPSSSGQKYVLDECQKWNLVWVGRNKVNPLEPDKVEILLGFHKNHTQGRGSAKDMFSDGINVLSLFYGISDAEVAFYCLGIPLKTDAQELNDDRLEQLMSRFRKIDLVVGGVSLTISPAASRYTLAYSTIPEPWKGERHKFNSPNFLAS